MKKKQFQNNFLQSKFLIVPLLTFMFYSPPGIKASSIQVIP